MTEMDESIWANRRALEQLWEHDNPEENFRGRYREDRFESHFDKDNYGEVVNQMAKKIAQAAFGSRQERPRKKSYFSDQANSMWESIKEALSKPGAKEVAIVMGILGLKGLMWFVYRSAAKEGLEIVDL